MAAPRPRRHAAAMAASHELGRHAEATVAARLRATGWQILATNWRFGHKEIDIIARRDDVVAFVEVKCRSGPAFGHPAEAVTAAKRRDLAAAARAWIARHAPGTAVYRFDVCAVTTAPAGRLHVEHLEDAWRP